MRSDEANPDLGPYRVRLELDELEALCLAVKYIADSDVPPDDDRLPKALGRVAVKAETVLERARAQMFKESQWLRS